MRQKFPVAVHLFFLRDSQLLLLRRFNTGYEDGNYSVVAGHVDAGETVTQAAIREAEEEIGVDLSSQDIEIVHESNRRDLDPQVLRVAGGKRWVGEISNCEPGKCDQLAWYPIDDLPQNIIPYVRAAIAEFQNGSTYSEFGWRDKN